MLKKILMPKLFPVEIDAALLVLRTGAGVTLFLRHGVEKIVGFSLTSTHGSDPIHIGPIPTRMIAFFSDSVLSLLVALGLVTRGCALFIFCNVFVAWAFVLHFPFFGAPGYRGEIIVLYLTITTTLFLAGGGRFSLDYLLTRDRSPR